MFSIFEMLILYIDFITHMLPLTAHVLSFTAHCSCLSLPLSWARVLAFFEDVTKGKAIWVDHGKPQPTKLSGTFNRMECKFVDLQFLCESFNMRCVPFWRPI
jgi:hypothetical protein